MEHKTNCKTCGVELIRKFRSVAGFACNACKKAAQMKWRRENPAKWKAVNRRWRVNNRDKSRSKDKRNIVKKQELTKPRAFGHYNRWTREDESRLSNLIPIMTYKDAALAMGRTYKAISNKVKRLQLNRPATTMKGVK